MERLAFKHSPEDGAIAAKEAAREDFEGAVTLGGSGRDWAVSQQRPAAGKFNTGDGAMAAFSLDVRERNPFFRRNQKRAQSFETIRSYSTLGDQFSQGLLDAGRKQAGLFHKLAKEGSAVPRQCFEDLLRVRRI